MKNKHHLALMRGVNVGGKNIIKMAELRACFEDLGFSDVATYIQSGNVLFGVSGKTPKDLASSIEKEVSKRFKCESSTVVLSHDELENVVKHAPKGFGKSPAKYRYDVIFLKEPLTAGKAIESVRTREGVDEAHAGKGVLYFSRLISRATQSYLRRIAETPIYQQMTVRNWNTTTKLLALMEERGGAGPQELAL
ncbi:MAG: DUF1697 domain-containing protein [Gemmatimonadota bacterium]|nr:MAG: DUF1697 domain-containing protein [Gemmatimonadota bacterium]